MHDSTHTYLTLNSLFLTRTAIKTRLLFVVHRGEQRISLVNPGIRNQNRSNFGILQRRNPRLFPFQKAPHSDSLMASQFRVQGFVDK